jgi:hypothetical protein
MATEKWVAGSGAGLTWADAFATATLDSITNGNAILSGIAITNGTALDVFADISIALGSITAAAPNYIGIYLYPLNKDGSTYGDSRFGTSATGVPPANYWVGNIGFPTGAAAITGSLTRIVLPPGTFKFVLYNQAGATLVGSNGNTCQYRTYNRAIA